MTVRDDYESDMANGHEAVSFDHYVLLGLCDGKRTCPAEAHYSSCRALPGDIQVVLVRRDTGEAIR